MQVKEANTPVGAIKRCAGYNDTAGLVDLPLRIKSRENDILVYKKVEFFSPGNRVNRSGTGKLFIWHDELNRYGLCWDSGEEFTAEPVRLMLENYFTEYNVLLVLKIAQNNINMICNAGSQARGIIVLTDPIRYALFLGKAEWHLEEMLEAIRVTEPVLNQSRTAGPEQVARTTHPNQNNMGIYYHDLLTEMMNLDQELIKNLRPESESENIRRQARRLAIDLSLAMKIINDYIAGAKNNPRTLNYNQG